MHTVEFLRDQLQTARGFLAGTMADVTPAAAHVAPPGRCNSIASIYAHVVTGEDGFVQALLRGSVPLSAGAWAGRTGLSEPPPDDPSWSAWAARLRLDLEAARAYAQKVANETDAWLASLTEEDLDRTIDFSAAGFGIVTLGWAVGSGVLGHVTSHWGEICAIKGLHGGRGFPV